MIKAVLFDYGGVLTPSGGKGSISKTLALIYGLDASDIVIDDLHEKLRKGLIGDDEFFTELNRRFPGQAKATKEAFFEKADLLKRNEKVYQLAAKLRPQGIKTGILSNIYAMTAELLKQHGAYDGFDPLVLSCYVHMDKPEPGFYEFALGELGAEPSEVIFVDDQEKCIPPAKALGIHTVLAKTEDQIVSDVKQILKTEGSPAL